VNGLLFSARGIGSVIGALYIASLGKSFSRGLTLCLAAFIFPILFIAFSFVRAIPLALLLLMGVGMSMILVLNLANALIQTITPDFLRGRVMGVYSLIFFGMMPVGSLWTGYLAHRIGEPSAVVFNALAMLLCAFLVWTTAPQVRSR
jgi:MFS family permease